MPARLSFSKRKAPRRLSTIAPLAIATVRAALNNISGPAARANPIAATLVEKIRGASKKGDAIGQDSAL